MHMCTNTGTYTHTHLTKEKGFLIPEVKVQKPEAKHHDMLKCKGWPLSPVLGYHLKT